MSGQGKAPQAPGHPWASRWHPALSPGCRGATGTPRAPRVSAPPAKQRRLSAGLGASGASRSLRSELFYFFLFIKHQDKPRGERSSEPPSRRRFAVTPCREAPMPCPATTGSARLAPCPCPTAPARPTCGALGHDGAPAQPPGAQHHVAAPLADLEDAPEERLLSPLGRRGARRQRGHPAPPLLGPCPPLRPEEGARGSQHGGRVPPRPGAARAAPAPLRLRAGPRPPRGGRPGTGLGPGPVRSRPGSEAAPGRVPLRYGASDIGLPGALTQPAPSGFFVPSCFHSPQEGHRDAPAARVHVSPLRSVSASVLPPILLSFGFRRATGTCNSPLLLREIRCRLWGLR